jgi:predicted alpha/beta superfamily hydrolase
MSSTVSVRVHYPAGAGRILLRAEPDWERDLEPVAEDPAGGTFDFELPVAGAHAYFKPVLRRDGELHWAQGPDSLALASGRRSRSVWPHFLADSSCSVCNVHELESAEGARHAVRVFYPPGYAENTLKRYPVLYMQDGQNLFFPGEAFGGHHWRIAETLGLLDSMNLVRKVIVVGVYPHDRMHDYTAPGYEDYGRFVVERLKPWVDRRYRTLTGPSDTAVMGSSLGGVASFHLAWSHPGVFGMAAAMSATFGYRDDLAERVDREPKRRVRFYLDSGWPRDNYEVTRDLRNRLDRGGWVEGRDYLYFAWPEARHDERAWATRVHVPFQFFFGRVGAAAG